ncbi:LrgB family protein [Metabacillus sp. GX 13764]|uniref:LrgB family protein n=1 Tax=Metabacillus kandeliae TaxID=2900151 RepID=UPI001E527FAF|nr:LrgB family protein [Metabacillus kandeliae]MCD7035179.1 LrgB family protein [Metabacillus kandeliae]
MTILAIAVTYLVYLAAKRLNRQFKKIWTHPLILCPLALICLLMLFKLPASDYMASSALLTDMLGPATAAFAIPIYKHRALIKQHAGIIISSVAAGSLAAIFSSYFMTLLIKANSEWILSVLPRSITTPIAIEVSKEIGGLPALTTVFVIITGIAGGVVGPMIIKWMSVRSPIARGLMFGMAAHGVGTSKALEYGELEGTFSSLSMITAGVMTLLWSYSLIPVMMHVFS